MPIAGLRLTEPSLSQLQSAARPIHRPLTPLRTGPPRRTCGNAGENPHKIREHGCHCGRIRSRARVDLDQLSHCSCSVCTKKGILHLPIFPDDFELLRGKNSLTTYTFGMSRMVSEIDSEPRLLDVVRRE